MQVQLDMTGSAGCEWISWRQDQLDMTGSDGLIGSVSQNRISCTLQAQVDMTGSAGHGMFNWT